MFSILSKKKIRQYFEKQMCLSLNIVWSKENQGTNDLHSVWQKVTFSLAKQLEMCYGKLDPRVIQNPPMTSQVVRDDKK